MAGKLKQYKISFDEKSNRQPEMLEGFSMHVSAIGCLVIDQLEGNCLKTKMFAPGTWSECHMENELDDDYVKRIIECAHAEDGRMHNQATQN